MTGGAWPRVTPWGALTTTQHSALGDLRRFGRLYPPGPRARLERGTPHGFSRRTLQALVDKGYARWDTAPGAWPGVVPVESGRTVWACCVSSTTRGACAHARAGLAQVADFDAPFTVTESGELLAAHDVTAPEVFHVEARTPDDVEITADDWSPFSTGYTGQHAYRGAVMHSSEQLAGRLAEDILTTPGTYVVTAVECHAGDYCAACGDRATPGEECPAGDGGHEPDPEPEPAGWIVLRRND